MNRRNNEELPLIGRRTLLKGIIATGALLLASAEIKSCLTDPKSDNSHDVLTDPDKFRAFVGKYQELSEQLAEDSERPIPYEVYLAVSMHESDSGTSELATEANNVFGVVAKDGWDGEVYYKPTEEEVSESDIQALREEFGDELVVLSDYGDGRLRVRHPRPFRKYDTPEDSFRDFTNKLYFQNQDGSYRYADVVDYLLSGERDPAEVVRLMSDNDTEGEAQYATGREWRDGVTNYIYLVQQITGNVSGGSSPEDPPSLPDQDPRIDIDKIDFSELNEPRDTELVKKMKEAMESLTVESYTEFEKNGISQQFGEVKSILKDIIPASEFEEYIRKKYDRGDVDLKFIVWHLWANGVKDTGTASTGPSGNSQSVTLSDQIKSWYNAGSGSSCGYILSDNSPSDLWQLTATEFGRSNHVGHGINGPAAETHPATNDDAIGIEVQADSVYDMTSEQFKSLLLWTTNKLFSSGLVDDGMERSDTDAIIEAVVVGHGKNEGLEFGVKYTRPLIQALQQFVYIAIKA